MRRLGRKYRSGRLKSTRTRNCNWCASKDDQVNSRPRQGSGYLPDGSYQTVSMTNLHSTATTGSSGVLQRVKKSDMLLTIMAHPRFRMDHPFSRSTCVLPWIPSAASACAFVRPPDHRGRNWPQRHVILDFDYKYASHYRYWIPRWRAVTT